MAFSIPDDWTGSGGRDDVQISVQPTAGNWLVATVSYRAIDGTEPLASVADMAMNWWVLLGSASDPATGTRVEVWACPAVDYASFPLDIVYTAISHIHADDVGSVCVNVAEVAGFVNNFPTVVSVTPLTAAAATSFSIPMPAPGKPVWVLAAAATDNTAVAVTPPGVGWGTLTAVQRDDPDLVLVPAWTAVSTTITPSWSTGSAVNWTGVVVAVAETGDVWPQPNNNWPATRLQLGPSVGQETPLPRVTWVDQTERFHALAGAQRGIQYELGRPQSGKATLTLANFDDGITPEAAGTYDLYTPYQLLMAWNGKVYPVSSGYVEQWQRRWADPHHGYVDGECVDALATLVQTVPTPLRGEYLRHAPTHYWPLADPSGSTSAANISGRSLTLLNPTQSKYGTSDATADFGAQTDIPGDPGSGWQQQGLVPADTKKGFALVGEGADFPALSGGVTIFGIADIPQDLSTQPTSGITLCILRSGDARNGTVIKFALNSEFGFTFVTVWDKDTGVATTTNGIWNWPRPGPIPWALRFNRTGWRATFQNLSPNQYSGTCDLPDTFSKINFGGEADEIYNGNSGNVTHSHLAIFDRELTDGEVTQLLLGKAFIGWRSQEGTHQRIQRFAATAQASTPRALDFSATAGSADATTAALAERAADYADQDTGLLFGDAAGYLRLRTNSRTNRQAVRWVLGDDTANGEIPFQPDAAPAMGPAFLFNRVEINNSQEANLGGTTQFFNTAYNDTTHTAVDAASGTRYGWRPLERATHLYSPADAFGLAHWLLAQYKTPRHRFEAVTVDAKAFPAAWPLVLGVEVGDLVDVVRRPVGQAAVRVACRVMSVRHDIQNGRGRTRAQVTLTLAAAPPPVLLLGSATKGRLGDNTIGW
ncbi:hypothetical protein E1264_18415 [Actinomadura sp. KC216]|uniref:hypothetical protein n=1 Tax=Actinomadura sp. KC216 TaxID=2530370 RepID=UPI00104503EE|nr:hypothetical protein [Actinomadura sp. KC216]TDB86270.1 hypothetical protein E1264_18415 [Actinomadura sp. KC216]